MIQCDCSLHFGFFCFKQKTAYEMRISDGSSDVCSSDLLIVQSLPRKKIQTSVPLIFVAGLVSSALFIHTAGMAGLVFRADMTWAQAFDVDKVFWIGDVIKNVAMALVATALHRAFPDLLDRRPRRSDEIGSASCRARLCQSV